MAGMNVPERSEISTCEASSLLLRVEARASGVMPLVLWFSTASLSVRALMMGVRTEYELRPVEGITMWSAIIRCEDYGRRAKHLGSATPSGLEEVPSLLARLSLFNTYARQSIALISEIRHIPLEQTHLVPVKSTSRVGAWREHDVHSRGELINFSHRPD